MWLYFIGLTSDQLVEPRLQGTDTAETKYCPISLAVIAVTLQGFQQKKALFPVTKGYRQWRFYVSIRVGFKRTVT